jgi:adenine-specific DNA-methyltransferase
MAHIDALIEKISDSALRDALRGEVDTLLHKRSFGLVFQEHKPETVELPNYQIQKDCKVRIRSESDGNLWTVTGKSSDGVVLASGELERVEPLRNVVAVREFGNPIYPGLSSLGTIERGGEKPFHSVINAENYHALETLLYVHKGQVDVIYIDPPYNSGAKDWKYNNDYVDTVDDYRHSKWLAFIERRLKLAEQLLAPDGALIITIDEHEVHHLGVLLEQTFRNHSIQMVTAVINPKGVTQGGLSRVEEYIFFVTPEGMTLDAPADDLLTFDAKGTEKTASIGTKPRWQGLLHSGEGARRQDRPSMFYPVFIDEDRGAVLGAGEPLLTGDPVLGEKINGKTAVWPVRKDGSWGRWYVSGSTLNTLTKQGYVSLGGYDANRKTWALSYLYRNLRNQIESGGIEVLRFDEVRNVVELEYAQASLRRVKTVWHRSRHDAGAYGSDLIANLLGDRRFPFPKSLYSVTDALRPLVRNKPNALVLDFFAGSGTTGHAVAYLNAEDGGQRRSVLVTNNEVSVAEGLALRSSGHLPGDAEWEQLGIFHHVTRPRIEAAVSGKTADGTALTGTYLSGQPFSDGFDENVEFFDLTYEDPDLISMGRKFKAVAPLLWLKAGATGPRVEEPVKGWSMPAGGNYAVLFDAELWSDFVKAVKQNALLSHVFIVTESPAVFQHISSELPTHIERTQLYDDYLRSFQINTESLS